MKISKLFHWLYALIMFLPVFFWIPTAFYYGFNEHAVAPEKQVEIYEQKNIVFNQEVVTSSSTASYTSNGDVATFYFSSNIANGHMFITRFDLSVSNTDVANGVRMRYPFISATEATSTATTRYSFIGNGGATNVGIQLLLPSAYNGSTFIYEFTNVQIFDLTKMFGAGNEPTIEQFDIYFPNVYYAYVLEQQEVLNIATGNYKTYSDITDNMNSAWQDVWSLPMFSWTHDTFFSAPFNYIAGLFGIQAGNTLSYCLSYWFSISIIWLVFDLMIYVPLLVHRWLDKAGIQ